MKAARIPIRGPASPAKRQLWRVVDGAVRDAMASHPDWLASERAALKLRNSITKRVVGSVMGYAETSAWGRSGSSSAANGPEERLPPDGPEPERPPVGAPAFADFPS